MSKEELYVLLMGYLDGELSAEDRARVEAALAEDDALRTEFDEMRKLKELTHEACIDTRTDEELDKFWNDVYNQTERHTAWALLLIGLCGVIFAGCYLFFTHPWPHWSIKVAAGCGAVGTLLMLWSVWRERQRILPHDRYSKEVHR